MQGKHDTYQRKQALQKEVKGASKPAWMPRRGMHVALLPVLAPSAQQLLGLMHGQWRLQVVRV